MLYGLIRSTVYTPTPTNAFVVTPAELQRLINCRVIIIIIIIIIIRLIAIA